MALFAVVFLVPNYFAELQRYSARDIGVLMVPYGLVQFVMSFLTPPLMRKVGAKLTIVAGFVFVAAGCLMNIHLNLNASANVIEPSLIVRGIGQSLVVIALGVMAVDGIEKSQMGSASGVFNMLRNLGGAIGIAVASQIVVERTKMHAMRIGEQITPFSPSFQQRMIEMVRHVSGTYPDRTQALLGPGLAGTRQSALALFNKLVEREAQLLAYSDTFLIAGVTMALCAIGALALRRHRSFR